MRRLWPWAAVFLAGAVLGAGGLWLTRVLPADQELARQKAELTRLTLELREREEALRAAVAETRDQADRIRSETGRALGEVDRILAVQGSAVQRLKEILAVLKRLRAEQTVPEIN